MPAKLELAERLVSYTPLAAALSPFSQCNAIRALVLVHARVRHSHPCAASAQAGCGGAPRRASHPYAKHSKPRAGVTRSTPSLRDPGISRKSGHHAHTSPLRSSASLQTKQRRQQAPRQKKCIIHDRRRLKAAIRTFRTQITEDWFVCLCRCGSRHLCGTEMGGLMLRRMDRPDAG